VVTADHWGLAAACFNAFLDNTVFFAVMDALGLDARSRSQASPVSQAAQERAVAVPVG
jgi:hypothetical protein